MTRSKEGLTGITYHPERPLQPYSVWIKGSVVHFCDTNEQAEAHFRAFKPRPPKVPTVLPIPLPLQGDNGGANKGGSHHRRLPGAVPS